jgi:histidine triad (HIT) family protein
MDCIFCKIIQKEIKANIFYEDDEVLVIHDIAPKAPKHVLMMPKKHIQSIIHTNDEDEKLMGKLLTTVRKMGEKLGLSQSGYKLIVNNGKASGQQVEHLHIHLLGGWKENPNWKV